MSHDVYPSQTPEVVLVEGDYYLDGPVLLKSGIRLLGDVRITGDHS